VGIGLCSLHQILLIKRLAGGYIIKQSFTETPDIYLKSMGSDTVLMINKVAPVDAIGFIYLLL
jgi:hypothetical protein